MSRIYKLKTVGSCTSAPVAEGKSDVQLLSLKVQQRERHAQPNNSETQQCRGQLHSQKIRTQLENQQLEVKLTQLCSQEEPVAKQTVLKQLRNFQLKERECEGMPQLTQRHERLQQKDQQLHNQMMHSKDEETCHTQKTLLPLQQRNIQKNHPKLQQPSNSFTVNPKSSPSPENPPKNPGRSLTALSLSASPSTSTSPSPSPFLPLFSLRNSAAVQGKRGNTITINPKKSAAVAASASAPGMTRSCPSAPNPSLYGVEEKGKKRYPTAEEIEVIGGYQSLEKSCLAKGSGTQKTVKVCFDEVQLEQVFEYPSESSVLATFAFPPLPGPEREEEKEEEDDEEDEEGLFLLRSSKTVGAGAGRILRVDESCHQ